MYKITALGQKVKYDPETALRYLRIKFKCDDDESLVRLLYAKKGHRLSHGQAGGILQLFKAGVHVSNMLLLAAEIIKSPD